jgi:DMSO/TMAO reductase YedYZ molybdopterin-dependent catalytic subunit
LQDGFIMATHFDGRPLSPDHGYPLRGVAGVLPGHRADDKYFWKGGKWLRALEFRADDRPGFWERNGYHNQADVWKEQRHGYSFM